MPGMKKDDFLSLFYPAFSYHFKKTCEGFSRVAWIEDDGFLFGHIVHGVSDFPAWIVVSSPVVICDEAEAFLRRSKIRQSRFIFQTKRLDILL